MTVSLRNVALAIMGVLAFGFGCASGSRVDGFDENTSSISEIEDQSFGWDRLQIAGYSSRVPIGVAISSIDRELELFREKTLACYESFGVTGAQTQMISGEEIAYDNLFRPPTLEAAQERGLYRSAFVRAAIAESTRQPVIQLQEVPTGQGPGDPESEAFLAAVNSCNESLPVNSNTSSGLVDAYRADILSEPEISEAHLEWISCMTRNGYGEVKNAREVANQIMGGRTTLDYLQMDDVTRDAELTTLLESEREAAQILIECDELSYEGVVERWAALEARWLERYGESWQGLSERERLLFATTVLF